ncbi:hypothetical protein OIDMADRAFT_56541 [Oidiodendron maius Zn]|uniref:Heterokaryon incompatibility domain-containing protein n=1 Tax=Oidiodendron maius (strain Zn) TaxID=913774 RepID=A0A0C3HAM3_OIDMZ|nr:hypothetical protein OIDMADRAFT_56541 [Oidiodendron maius Zn]
MGGPTPVALPSANARPAQGTAPASSSGPSAALYPKSLCTLCQNILFASLPSEDEPGQAHHSSLKALKASAVTCTLCTMILGAAMRIRENINEEFNGNDTGRFISFAPSRLHNGRRQTVQTHFGAFCPGTVGRASPSKPGPGSMSKQFPFENDHAIRPWLFGSWWDLGEVEAKQQQLVGLGVRLGRSAEIENGEGNKAGERMADGSAQDSIKLRGTFLRLRTRADSPFASYIPGRLVTKDSSSPLAYQRIRKWLDHCDSSHPCMPSKEKQLPTRILDVGITGSDTVTLIEGAGRKARFLALSHRWGTSHRITLTKATVSSFMAGIKLDKLPKTFLDAVHIARTLQIRYLWIDSMCIIQDDPEDWEKEAEEMASVYHSAYLTIAASFSEDDSSGCFPPWSLRSKSARISSDIQSHGMGPITANATPLLSQDDTNANARAAAYIAMSRFAMFVYPSATNGPAAELTITEEWMPSSLKSDPTTYLIPAFGRPFNAPGLQALATRGWTLQERILSPRTLHFCPDQMYWECPVGQLAEDGGRISDLESNLSRLITTQQQPREMDGLRSATGMTLIEGYPPAGWTSQGRWKGGWLELVRNYTTRRLTMGDDKLPALSGLAKLLGDVTGDVYMAGLWVGHLLEDMFWRVKAKEEQRIQVPGGFAHVVGKTLCRPKRTAKYRAPTWSWAALDDAHVVFEPLDFDRMLATIVDRSITLATKNTYGRVTDGWLKLKGPLHSVRRAPPDYRPRKEEPLGFGVFMTVQTVGGMAFGEAYFDIESEKQDQCMALFLDTSNALLLTPVDGRPGTFTRLGTAKFLRTSEQRRKEPLYDSRTNTANKVPYGPATSGNSMSEVIIV